MLFCYTDNLLTKLSDSRFLNDFVSSSEIQKLERFCTYKEGWVDGHRGKPLKKKSVEDALNFLWQQTNPIEGFPNFLHKTSIGFDMFLHGDLSIYWDVPYANVPVICRFSLRFLENECHVELMNIHDLIIVPHLSEGRMVDVFGINDAVKKLTDKLFEHYKENVKNDTKV
jgi:hypothetical protein